MWSRIMRGISIKGYRGFRPPEDLIYSSRYGSRYDLSVLKPWILYVSSPCAYVPAEKDTRRASRKPRLRLRQSGYRRAQIVRIPRRVAASFEHRASRQHVQSLFRTASYHATSTTHPTKLSVRPSVTLSSRSRTSYGSATGTSRYCTRTRTVALQSH